MNAKDLIKTQAREELTTAISAVNDMEMAAAELLQPQGHAGQRAHKGGIHHRAIGQIDHKFAIAAVDHFSGKLLQVAAIQEIALAFYFNPDGWAINPYLNRRFHCY